jgi:hypothetical protein
MKLERQVTSLKFSKYLEELGVKQESIYFWQQFNSMGKKKWALSNTKNGHSVSAFSVAELGEMLPELDGIPFCSYKCSSESLIKTQKWNADLIGNEDTKYLVEATTEADVRAKLLISLIAKRLIQPNK